MWAQIKKVMKKLIISLAATAIIFASCEKNKIESDVLATELTTEEVIVNDDATMEDAIETSDYEVDFYSGSDENIDATISENGITLKSAKIYRHRLRYLFGQAPVVIIDTAGTGYPIVITLDYGDGTELNNGKILKGKIVITLYARPRTDGAERKVEYDNFYVDSVGMVGYYINTFQHGEDSSKAILTYDRMITMNFYDGSSVQHQENIQREWVSGYNTPYDLSDDEIHITGTSQSTGRLGTEYQRKIVSPLVKLGTCRILVSGVVEYYIDGEVTMTLDYGDGECDNLATINRNGIQKIIRVGRIGHR